MQPALTISDHDALAQLIAWTNGIALPMFIVEAAGRQSYRFVHCNSALAKVIRCPASALIDERVEHVLPPRLADRLIAKYRSGFASDAPVSFEESIQVGGTDTFWQTTLSKPDGFDGKLLLGIAVPNTEQKQREFEMAKAMAEMAARFDDLKLYSKMAAHDARSPLATVSNLIDIIKEDFVDFGDGKGALLDLCQATVTEALSQITATLQRAQELSLNGGVKETVDLATLTGDIAAMVDPEARRDITLPRGIVMADAVLLQMALRNLMANAVRFCNTRIEVRAIPSERDDCISIIVADDGPGLPPGTTIQDLTTATRAQDAAHGFGLDAIGRLATSRGGTLETEGAPDAASLPGAVFRLTLPGRFLDPEDSRVADVVQFDPTG